MNNPKQLTFPWNKDNKSSFESFYVSEANKQLVLLLQDELFNDDLLIFGTKDSGKTFLLQALCNLYNDQKKLVFFFLKPWNILCLNSLFIKTFNFVICSSSINTF